MTNQWIDITQPLNQRIAEWPGDTPFSYEVAISKEQSGSVNIGKLTMSTHIGTHTDAPFHYDDNGLKILELPVDLYIGKACLVDVTGVSCVTRADLEPFDFDGAERLLLKTGSHPTPTKFPENFTVIGEDVGPLLKERGVRLIGVDTPSVDSETSKDLLGHHSLYRNDVIIIENLVLHSLEEGNYELIALPLALEDADGSPVRAVVRRLQS
ncbi:MULTISPECIES: arylformamidase [unclassified Sporosarcina]|uniref:arylformamidase n=1 Tax=unclassified Sporosarcina TaxID=2647733 RepID=UPI000C1721B3|nr:MULTISPECIES: arylformamidase [unclassified Sporosarcina]PIC98468.1 arylformamidase [Sporosarcina sp. P29]PID04971.1 arylformamidase [Sporosarcina sp. P30]PID08230.1 arylformamidase [Sporosarcina sp. P31]PID11310.1 arylformamidase [Sporosarcina sp. P32b]